MPDVLAKLLVGRLCLELGLCSVELLRVQVDGFDGSCDSGELIEACQFGSFVRCGTFTTDLGETAVSLVAIAIGDA